MESACVAEHSLKPLPPLGGASARDLRLDGIHLREDTSRALGSVAARARRQEEVESALGGLAGAVPGPGRWVEMDGIAAVWTGPQQWFVEAPFETCEDIAAILADRFGDSASITEQTDAWARFALDGPGAVAVLERLCPLDVAAMETGAAGRTIMEHIGAFVLCLEAGSRFAILGPRSSASSLFHALKTAAHSAL